MVNDQLTKAVNQNSCRLKAFAELPFHLPAKAAKELRRCVTEMGFVGAMLSGSVGGEGTFLDRPEFAPLLSTFEELDVPLFLHPGVPPKPVSDAYYNLPSKPEMSVRFSLGGWGWHNEGGIHVMRLVLSGTLDRHPRLKIIIGHHGEMVPFMMQRLEEVFEAETFGLSRSIAETLRAQVWIATSGFLSLPLTQLAISTWGVDRILFGVDYPYTNLKRAPEYPRALEEILSPPDLVKTCQTNAEKLLKFEA